MARLKRTKDRPFPWRCGSCDEKEVYRTATPYKTTIKYEGRPYDGEIPDLELPKCRKCGEVVFDNHTGHQINHAFRKQLGLLQPEQIHAGRTELGLSQKELAAQLGVAEESVCRWETGSQIQSRVVDRQIRLFFEFPSVRKVLVEYQQGRAFGEVVKAESSDVDVEENWSVRHSEAQKAQAALQNRLEPVLEDFRLAISQVSGEIRSKIGQRLERLMADLEHVPESDAAPLLDHFSELLEMWAGRVMGAGKRPSTADASRDDNSRDR